VTAPTTLARPETPHVRTVQLVLARAHLRLGSLALARVELETMAGLGILDTAGLVDLAEVRWRTGDLLGAGEAAGAALRRDEDQPLALLIAAEAAAAVGRPTEARTLATRAMARATTSIDSIFAGMPRSGVWPTDAAEPPPTAGTLFHREDEPADAPGAGGPRPEPASTTAGAPAAAPDPPLTLGFWDGDGTVDASSAGLPDPGQELEAARAAFVAGAFAEASLRFGLALRLAPALAPAILEATDGTRDPGLTMVRGDAFRLAGHEDEARRAYAVAASGGLPERRRRPRTKPQKLSRASRSASLQADTPVEDPADAETRDEAAAQVPDAAEAPVPDEAEAPADAQANALDAPAEMLVASAEALVAPAEASDAPGAPAETASALPEASDAPHAPAETATAPSPDAEVPAAAELGTERAMQAEADAEVEAANELAGDADPASDHAPFDDPRD
jgi:hypothetical protein